jgi:hypothetical protein
LWPHVREMVGRAFARTDLGKVGDLDGDVLSGLALLWIVIGERIECAAVTYLNETHDSRVCFIAACGGFNVKRWAPLLSEIEKYAKAEDCDAVRWIGRRGWKRIYPEYREIGAVFERKLNG